MNPSLKSIMRGAITGDIIGSPFEYHGYRDPNFPLFSEESRYTDDTVCTIAVADAILHGKTIEDALREWCRQDPKVGYGGYFKDWIQRDTHETKDSLGNGCIMRVSPCFWLSGSKEEALEKAKESCYPTHVHKESYKGVQAVIEAMYLNNKETLAEDLQKIYQNIYQDSFHDISVYTDKRNYKMHVQTKETVERVFATLANSNDIETIIRNSVMNNKDTDTSAAVALSIAECYYGIPDDIWAEVLKRLPDRFINIITKVENKYNLFTGI